MARTPTKLYEIDGIVSKECTRCKTIKPLESFSINRRDKSGRQPKCKDCNAKYAAENSEREKQRAHDHYWKDHEYTLVHRKELRQRPEARAKKAEQDKKYYEENKEKIQNRYRTWSRSNRDSLNEYHRNWYQENIEHARILNRAKGHRRRLNCLRNGNNTLTSDQVREIIESSTQCYYCLKNCEELSLDHVVPISRGGQNCIENIVSCCKSCNSSKNDKLLHEWCIILEDDSPIKNRVLQLVGLKLGGYSN